MTTTNPHPAKIRWDNRLVNDNGSRCKVCIDGTDFRIQEPTPFSPRWFTKKFKSAGLRYEVGSCIQTGMIVWINGPFPCGEWPDLRIALDDIVYMLEGDERVIADKGYGGHPEFFDCPWRHLDNAIQTGRKALVRARHECINRRFKQWDILQQTFRHSIYKHANVFRAVANIVQFLLEQEPTWQVEYNDRIDNEFDFDY